MVAALAGVALGGAGGAGILGDLVKKGMDAVADFLSKAAKENGSEMSKEDILKMLEKGKDPADILQDITKDKA